MEKFLISDNYLIVDRKSSLPIIFRLEYRIVELLLIVKLCSKRKSISLDRLYKINNSIIYRYSANGDVFIMDLLKYSFADKLIILLKNGSVKLTPKGMNVANEIIKNNLFNQLIEQINKVRI
ncbi:MAG: hypothetical protein WC006_07755 [Bacilli bacterium]